MSNDLACPTPHNATATFRSPGHADTRVPVRGRRALKALFKGAVGSTPPCEGGAIGTSSGVMTCANGASEIENRGRWAYIRHSGSARADMRVNGGSYEDRTLPPVAALLATTSQGGACAITQRCCPGALSSDMRCRTVRDVRGDGDHCEHEFV